MIRFGGERFERLLGMIANPDVDGNETPLESKMFSRLLKVLKKRLKALTMIVVKVLLNMMKC